jgi:hypothetical protein
MLSGTKHAVPDLSQPVRGEARSCLATIVAKSATIGGTTKHQVLTVPNNKAPAAAPAAKLATAMDM